MEAAKAIPEDEKPTVYLEADFGGRPSYWTVGTTHPHHELFLAAGGNNIYSNVIYYKEVSPESVAIQNPQVILKYWNSQKDPGIEKETSDTKSLEDQRDNIMNRAELKNTPAVKNKRVYVYSWDCTRGGARFFLGIGYMGKWLHPQLFADYNPREAYQEYLTRFLGLGLDVVDKGVFVYPEP
jgi:iron complex transport system substrate-binding protein